MNENLEMNLQLFGEGGAGGAGGDGGQAAPTGGAQAAAAPEPTSRSRRRESGLANVSYGRQDTPQVAPAAQGEQRTEIPQSAKLTASFTQENRGAAGDAQEQPRPDFESLIRGEYKADFEKRVQGIMGERLKKSREQEAAVAPILEMLSQRYGLETDEDGKCDLGELGRRISSDTSYLEEEAAEKGLPTEVVAKLHTLESLQKQSEREKRKAEMQRQFMEQQQRVRGHFETLQQQAEEVKKLYPGFDLNRELGNKAFVEMTKPGSNIDVLTAYRALHHDELAGAEMKYAVEKSAQKISASVAANSRRPAENGLGASVAMTSKTDPASLGKDDFKEIRKRVARGEKIVF